MKAAVVGTNLIIPLDEIVEVLRPVLVQAILDDTRAARPRRKAAPTALIDGASKVSRALARYEGSVGTRDERLAIHNLIAAATGLRRVLKDNSHAL